MECWEKYVNNLLGSGTIYLMATLQQIRDKADAKLAEFWPILVLKQDAYFAKYGKYFQLRITSKVIDGIDTIFEVKTPSDEKYPQDADLTFSSPIPFQIQVDEWVNNNGSGYSGTVHVELLNGDVYTRTRNNLKVDTGWNKVISEII